MKSAIERFGHLECVWLAGMVLVVSLTGFLSYHYDRIWQLLLLLAYALWLMAMRVHQPQTCTICGPLRQKAGGARHWAVKMCHREPAKHVCAGLLLMWIFTQFLLPPVVMYKTVWFAVIEVVMAGVIVFWGYVFQVHMSRCAECQKSGGGGPRRRRRRTWMPRPAPVRWRWLPAPSRKVRWA